jgi:hypothetical protein
MRARSSFETLSRKMLNGSSYGNLADVLARGGSQKASSSYVNDQDKSESSLGTTAIKFQDRIRYIHPGCKFQKFKELFARFAANAKAHHKALVFRRDRFASPLIMQDMRNI